MFRFALIIAPALGMQLTDLPTDVAMVSTASLPLSSAWVDANGEVVLQQHSVDKARKKERGFTKSKQVCSVGTSLLQRVHDHSRKPGSGEKAGRTKSKEEHKQYKALLRSCRKECKEDSECMGFQLMGGTCESIYDLNVAETAKGEDCTRDSDCCFLKVIDLTLDGDDVIVNVAEDDDDDDYEEDDKEEMILLSSNSTPDFSVKYTGGCCLGNNLRDESGQTADLSACKAACRAASSCSFLSFCPSEESSCQKYKNNCALYSSCTSKYGHSGYTSYTKNTQTVAPTTVAPTTVAPTTVAPTTVAPTTEKTRCSFSEEKRNLYIPTMLEQYDSMDEAKDACNANSDCGGVTLYNGNYETRQGPGLQRSGAGASSWVCETTSTVAPTTVAPTTVAPTPTTTPTPSGCVEPQGVTHIKHKDAGLVKSESTFQTCSQLKSKGFCPFSFVQKTCPCTCPPPAPSPAPPPSGGTEEECCPCVTTSDCAGHAFCCPNINKCSYRGPSGLTLCRANTDCSVFSPGDRSR